MSRRHVEGTPSRPGEWNHGTRNIAGSVLPRQILPRVLLLRVLLLDVCNDVDQVGNAAGGQRPAVIHQGRVRPLPLEAT